MNPARPPAGTPLLALEDLGDPDALAVDFRAGDALFSLLIVRSGDLVRAFENVCPHARSPLERPDGRVVIEAGRYLVCSAHGASFSIADGACAGGPANGPLTPFPIVTRAGVVFAA